MTQIRARHGLLATVAAAAMVLGGATAANAQEASPADLSPAGTPIVTPTNEFDAELAAEAEAIAQPLLDATDFEAQTFDAQSALAAGAAPQSVADYAAVYGSAHDVTGADGLMAPSSAATATGAAAACGGYTAYNGYTFWGFQWALDSCKTQSLITAVNLGAGGASSIISLLAIGSTVPPLAAFAGALVGMGAIFLNACVGFSSNGGIFLNSGNLSLPTCRGQ